jgi:hypothetical protein
VFDVAGDARRVDALVSLGAARLDAGNDGTVVLADPDGNEFCVRPASRHPAGSPPRRVATPAGVIAAAALRTCR